MFEILQQYYPFLSENSIGEFEAIGFYKKVSNKEIILESGKKNDEVIFIIEGTIRGYLTDDKGIEKDIMLRTSGIFIADPRAIFLNEKPRFIFESLGKSLIFIFNYSEFDQLAKRNSEIMELLNSILQDAILMLHYRVETMITMSPEERYNDLVRLNPKFLETTYSKHVACFLGITPVSLSRIIKRIKKKE